MYRNKRTDEIWYFKPVNGDGLRVPIKVKRHDINDVQISSKENTVFAEFAAKEFPRTITRYHSIQSLNESLLPLTDQVDHHVAIVLWNTILRFMGDMPEPRHTFLDTSSLELTTTEDRNKLYSPNSWMSTSDKLRFIVGLGINRPHLRDEIYCQLCKQVTDNPSSASLVKGWILLSLCFGCFAPSEKVEKVVISVMRSGPHDYVGYCDQKLSRTKKKGTRKQPPNSLELKAAQHLVFPSVLIELDDGREVKFEVDSSTTAKELCEDAADEMQCDHISGYGIQISMMDKHINLGSGSEKLMDAIWVCEQTAREVGQSDNSTAWRIYYHKDVFSPLEEFLVDISWTDFAYNFVVNGVKTGVSRLRRRFHSPEKSIHEKQTIVKQGSEKHKPEEHNSANNHDRISINRPSLSSNSSFSSFNDFGLPSLNDSGSDIGNVEFVQENNNPSQTDTSTLKRICETYSDSSKDVHTLNDYGKTNFAYTINKTNWKQNGELPYTCSHQSEPIKHPLLQRMIDNQELTIVAVDIFSAILVYMEKCTSHRSSKFYKMQLTRKIFGPVLKQEQLRDELYCQIMKQLSNNEDKSSFQQGWELMFLCTSLFPCSDDLLKEVMLFFVTWSKYEVMAMKCLTLLRKTVQTEPRKYPPHFVEFAAATKRCEYILHKVSFPDLTSKNFDVDSRTKIKDIENRISERLGLLSLDGYSLCIQVFSKVVALNHEDFIFDAIQQWTEAVELNLPRPAVYNNAKGIPYKLLFLRRVWKNVCPGEDPIADAMFHYPQEVFKHLRGYYKLTIEEASYLAALILKEKFEDEINCPEITQMFEELLPHHMIEELFPEVWRQYIITNCQNIKLKSESEIRKEFLLVLQKQDRFGSAYFKVGQKNFPYLPKLIIAGINRKGIHLIHPKSKDTIQAFPIENIVSHYREDNNYIFQVQKNIDNIDTYTLYTTQDYEIANMVSSYIPK